MNAHREAFFEFPLDPFQERACQAIDEGQNVLVCAPTGAGKTVVAEWAMMAALTQGKRCFYTTPLKALSNQKFFDLCQRFGEEYVGLSTGDVSVRGKADLVVMTTEVYRNMLYATGAAGGNPALERVAAVILDECHYMNDADRGTVWEESIIYSPPDIQVVGLSATVANASDMKAWLDEVHGPTALISTDFRPVPLRHFYFRKGELLSVFQGHDKTKRVNPKFARFRDERAPRRRGPRTARDIYCDPRQLVKRLESQDMLPAIYFVFSRRGCEKLMEDARGAVTVSRADQERIDACVRSRAVNSPEILEHPHLDCLRRGLAAHHAGVLPVWKSLVEHLFSEGLLKVVFATETLAAGINMPARTTIISALSKFTGEGLRPLTGSEMLQMSGRAGRRGMDKVGNVVIGAHPKESIDMVIALAKAQPEPLESHFLPTYGMVLNLLERRPMAKVKELLDRSFGQFLHRRHQAELGLSEERIGEVFEPPCPGPTGDRPTYLKLVGRRRALRGQLRDYEKALSAAGGDDRQSILEARSEIEQELAEINVARRGSPCHGCESFHECGELYEELGEDDKPSYWEEFVALSKVLQEAGYLVDERPTEEGRLLAQLRATNVYAVGESLLGPIASEAETMKPSVFAALCCLLMGEGARRDPGFDPPKVSREAAPLLTRVLQLCEEIAEQQLDWGIDRAVPYELAYCGVAEIWASGFSWEATVELSGLPDGDLFRILRRTFDLSRQVEYWDGAPASLKALAAETNKALLRGPLEENVAFFESPEGDPDETNELAVDETQLPELKPLRGTSKEDGGSRERAGRRSPPSGVGARRRFKRRPPGRSQKHR